MEATSNKKAAIILCSISLTMTVFIVLGFVYNATGFIYFMGINERALKIPLAWLCSIILAIEEFYKLKYCSTVVYMVPRA